MARAGPARTRADAALRRLPRRFHLDDAARRAGEGDRTSAAVATGSDVGLLRLRRVRRGVGRDAARRPLAALGGDGGDGYEGAPLFRGFQPRRRHGGRALYRRLRLAEFPDRLRQLPDAFDAADRLSLCADSAVRRAGGAVQPRADRQRPAPRLSRRARAAEGPDVVAGLAGFSPPRPYGEGK